MNVKSKYTNREIAIIGGGVAGLCTAIALKNIGIQVTIYERVGQLKGLGAGFGLAANAMQALDYLGLREGVEKIGHFLDSYNILDHKGRVLLSPDTSQLSDKYQEDNFAIHRADLHRFLIDQLPQECIILGKEAIKINEKEDKTTIYFADGTSTEVDAIIVADGVHSKIRQQMIPTASTRYSGYTCWRGVISNSTVKLKSSSETWGPAGRFGMTPLVNDRIYWYACINAPEKSPLYRTYKTADLLRVFKNYHPPIPKIIEETDDEQLLWNDIVDIAPLKKLAYNKILFIGDAGHATTPNMGQGACQAIEDAVVLQDELKKSKSIAQSFQQFEQRRLKRTRYITNTSWQIGKVAQWENVFMIGFRNTIMKLLPDSIKQIQLRKLLSEDFMSTHK